MATNGTSRLKLINQLYHVDFFPNTRVGLKGVKGLFTIPLLRSYGDGSKAIVMLRHIQSSEFFIADWFEFNSMMVGLQVNQSRYYGYKMVYKIAKMKTSLDPPGIPELMYFKLVRSDKFTAS